MLSHLVLAINDRMIPVFVQPCLLRKIADEFF
jgi:hypothetical protein